MGHDAYRTMNDTSLILAPRIRRFLVLAGLLSLQTSAAAAQLDVLNRGTANPTLLYRGEPMLKVGPIPEVAVFAVEWGSSYLRQDRWLDWMEEHRLGYGRVYPELGYPWVPPDAEGRLFPFEVARWENGRPLVDLTRPNPEYWENFARIIEESARRGIVLQMQLYQRVFFAPRQDTARWQDGYLNPANNVNGVPVPRGDGGYGLLQAMPTDPFWGEFHRQWVNHILEAIGDNGNVTIDLMNEGGSHSVNLEWIEMTLDQIERWERRNGIDLLVGMDVDHMVKRDDPLLEFVLSDPRFEVIIVEGSESHVVPTLVAGDRVPKNVDLAVEYRRRYHKPVISTNGPGYTVTEDPESHHLYQWYAMMTKVQGAGTYAKEYPIDFSDPNVERYATWSELLMRFFEGLEDYAALELASEKIGTAPGRYRLALASPGEAVVYLHAAEPAESIRAGQRLILSDLQMADGAVSVRLFEPKTGATTESPGEVRGGRLIVTLPEIRGDLALHVREAGS